MPTTNRMKQVLIALLLIGWVEAALAQNLTEQLYQQLGPCATTLEEEGEEFHTLKDAYAKQGYLSISGGWPTCGCGCNATVAAFRDAQKKYTFVRWEYWDCAQEFGLYTSSNIEEVLPKGWSINSFVDAQKTPITELTQSYFYIAVELPIYGTDVHIKLKPLPLGMLGKSNNGLVYNTKSVEIMDATAANLRSIANLLETEAQLDLLQTKGIGALPELLQSKIRAILKQNHGYTEAKFERLLNEAHRAYRIYKQLDFDAAIWGWDRTQARFFLKSKTKKNGTKTFWEFLKTAKTYEVLC